MATFLEGWSLHLYILSLFFGFLEAFLAMQLSRIKKYDRTILHEDENNISAVCWNAGFVTAHSSEQAPSTDRRYALLSKFHYKPSLALKSETLKEGSRIELYF